MLRSVYSRLFRPRDDALSRRQKSQVQVLRLLFLVGAILCLAFIPLFEASTPGAVDPAWARVLVSGGLGAVFAASYGSAFIRRTFAVWVRGTIVLVMAWFVLISALNGFTSDYEIGLLLLHSIFTVIAGLGARSIRPVVGFTTVSLGAAVGGVGASPASLVEEAVLLGGMATSSLVVALAVQRLIQTRERLQERESRLRGLAHSIPGVVFQFYARPDGTRGNHFVSEHAEEILGIAPDPPDFYERVVDRVPASHRAEMVQSVETAVETEQPWHHEFPFDPPADDRRWLLGTSAPRRKDGEVVFNGFLLDITERKTAEEELQRTKNRYQTLVENFPRGGVFLFDDECRYILAGGAELETVGLAPSDFEGMTPYDLFPEALADETVHYYQRALDGEVHVFEQQYHDKHYQILTLPVRTADGAVGTGMAVSLDVTAQKEQRRALREAKEQAEEASEIKTAMLANMSHEVRTPLTSIIGFSELLVDRLEGELRGFARRTHESSQRLSETLESILQLAKLEAGAASLDRELLSLVASVRDTVDLLRARATKKDIALTTEWPDEPVEGLWNDDALHRIGRNLVENAIKFTPEGGTVDVRVRRAGSEAVLAVEDTGIGIREELLPNIFQAFRQESEGLDREYQGSGLGLSIVDHLVEELGGRIDVETGKGEGTCFMVHLPLRPEAGG
jgi:PAS domain S-box-containing protein